MKNKTHPRSFRGFFRLRQFSIFVLALFALAFYACEDLDPSLGEDLIDSRLELFTDNLEVQAHSIAVDSVIGTPAQRFLLGAINDSIFGKTMASIYTEALPGTMPFTFGSGNDVASIDSVLLSFSYDGYWGDTLTPHTIKVYQLDENIPVAPNYSNQFVAHLDEPLITKTFNPKPKTPVVLGEDTLRPHLRITLPKSFGEQFEEDASEIGTISDNNQFRVLFPGFFITVENHDEPGSILYFDHQSAFTRLVIYYTTTNDFSLSHSFEMNQSFCRKFNQFNNFEHLGTHPDLYDQVVNGDTSKGEELLFLQAMSNYNIQLDIPQLEEMIANQDHERIAVNSAKLILPIESSLTGNSEKLANVVTLYKLNEEGDPDNVLDFILDQARGQNLNYFGGKLSTDKDKYSINLTQHIQSIIDQRVNYPNTPLFLRVASSAENAGAVIIEGTKTENPLRLEITYSKLKGSENP